MKTQALSLLLFCTGVLFGCSELKTLSNGSKVYSKLGGSWELTYITGPRITFDGLYPNKKPQLNFEIEEARVTGNTSCNSLSGAIKANGNKISFKEGIATTKMFCQGSGEPVFLKTLETVETYQVNDTLLVFSSAAGEVMRFTRK